MVVNVPVTVSHAACDLTDVLLTYRDYGGVTVTVKKGTIISGGLTLTVNPLTQNVTIDASGNSGNL
jgi:hypothetical protein